MDKDSKKESPWPCEQEMEVDELPRDDDEFPRDDKDLDSAKDDDDIREHEN